MKTLEELALKTTDITDILPKRITEYVETAARPLRYMRQLLRMNTQLLRQKGRSVHIPLRGQMTAGRVSEYTAVPAAYQGEAGFTTTEVTPFKIGCQAEISQESIDGAEIDVINAQLEEAGEAMATYEDDELMWEITGRSALQTETFDGDNSTVKFTVSYSPVINIVTVKVGGSTQTRVTDYKVDYYDGIVSFASAPTTGTDNIEVKYYYTDRTQVVDAGTAAALGYQDILDARNYTKVAKMPADTMIVYPDEGTDLMALTSPISFIDVSAYGDRGPTLKGEVGRIAGLSVLDTTQIFDGVVAVLKKVTCGWLVMKRNLQVKREDKPELDGYALYFYMEFAPKITRDTAISLIVNCAIDAIAI